MPASIAGMATAVPPHRIAQSDAAEIAKTYSCESAAQERLFVGLYRRSGVETRHSVVLDRSDGDLAGRQRFYTQAEPTTSDRMHEYAEHAGGLSVAAGGGALRDAEVAPGRVTHVVTVSCSGFHAPSFDVALIKQLGLPESITSTVFERMRAERQRLVAGYLSEGERRAKITRADADAQANKILAEASGEAKRILEGLGLELPDRLSPDHLL